MRPARVLILALDANNNPVWVCDAPDVKSFTRELINGRKNNIRVDVLNRGIMGMSYDQATIKEIIDKTLHQNVKHDYI